MSRALVSKSAPAGFDATVCGLFNLVAGEGHALPVAALTCLADGGQTDSAYIMRADPVHLRADQACLRLFEATTFSIDAEEARALVAAFNDFYPGRGWRLDALRPQRWYLSMATAPEISTVPPERIAGQDIDTSLPSGAQGREWHALLNEVQMLFHAHPVNAAREQRGEPAINSIWPWGGGCLPGELKPSIARVFTDHPLPMGLAQLAGISRRQVPPDGKSLLAELEAGVNLVIIDVLDRPSRYGDVDVWADGIRVLEQDWFGPLRLMLEQGRITSLDIYPVNGNRFSVTRQRLKYFWKRTRAFTQSCHRVSPHPDEKC